MHRALLLQLPIPQLNYGRQTGNIPLGAACLKQAVSDIPEIEVDICPESTVSYLSDGALLEYIRVKKPEIVGFSVFCWNIQRSLYLAEKIKGTQDCQIIFGGPEITPDNELLSSAAVDFLVFGEGESAFRHLMTNPTFWNENTSSRCAESVFNSSPSPYVEGLLEPHIENMLLLETQRGCPFHCGYCYYNKSRAKLAFKDDDLLLEAVQWAVDHKLSELYLLDPTINVRPGLVTLLEKIQLINSNKDLSLISEIRADRLDPHMADLFAKAGFTWFEVGLQSTNPEALRLMNRPTDLNRFLSGISLLKERRITPAIDLIAGLPGDNLAGFRQSVDFVADNGFHEDIQVFPLSILPGTDFRSNSRALGLQYSPEPPYPVLSTQGFSADDLLLAFDYAESRFDVCLYPMPDLDIAWRGASQHRDSHSPDHHVRIGGARYVSKLLLLEPRSLWRLQKIAHHLTHPYQVYIGPDLKDHSYMSRALEILTTDNPFTPLEVIFLAPEQLPDTEALLNAINLKRPHFLDLEQRYLFSNPGNRAVLFTLVTDNRNSVFRSDMQRQVYWWNHSELPAISDLQQCSEIDGLLVDPARPTEDFLAWQDQYKIYANEYLHIGFADVGLQKRWLMMTEDGTYYQEAFDTGVTDHVYP